MGSLLPLVFMSAVLAVLLRHGAVQQLTYLATVGSERAALMPQESPSAGDSLSLGTGVYVSLAVSLYLAFSGLRSFATYSRVSTENNHLSA